MGRDRNEADLARRQRLNDEDTRELLDRLPDYAGQVTGGAPHVTVAITTYPTTANAYYGVQPVRMRGVQREGSPVLYDVVGDPYPAANLGRNVPPEGTVVWVSRSGGIPVFIYQG